MKRFLFGFDEGQPERCARQLRDRGVDAVIVGGADERARAALAENGLELHLSYGAHGLSADFDRQEHWAVHASGGVARWFHSGCPNDEALAGARLNAALERACRTPGVRGVWVDGARFASFASAEGTEGFFSCFCPRCIRKMEALGIDAERVRSAALRLSAERRISDEAAIADWFRFRAACVAEFMTRFAERVHALPGRPLAGAFVFAPSLAGFVGQTARACAALDAVSPMLYRAYPHEDGPACLGHEWAAARERFEPQVLAQLSELAGGQWIPADGVERLRTRGFSPEHVGREVSAARAQLRRGQTLMPILQIEDERLADSVNAALRAGADGCGYFMCGQAPLEALPRP